jgi:hypothetical protein
MEWTCITREINESLKLIFLFYFIMLFKLHLYIKIALWGINVNQLFRQQSIIHPSDV